MSLSKRLAGSGSKRSANNQYIEPLIPGRPAFNTLAGVTVDPESAIRMSTVYSCVRLLADTISSLPVGAYVRRGRSRLPYATVYGDQPAWIAKPNRETTRLEFYEQIVTSFKLEGNAYILIVRNDMGDVEELYVVDPRNVRIERLAPNEPLVYFVKIRDSQGVYEQRLSDKDILHIPDFRLPGQRYGLSPIAACRTTIGSAMAADTYAASYFGNAANPGGVIEVPGELTQEQAGDIGRDWNITHTGPYRAGKIGILSGGASFKPLTINAQDAQLLDTRRFSVEEIARIFRVPLALLGHPVAGALSHQLKPKIFHLFSIHCAQSWSELSNHYQLCCLKLMDSFVLTLMRYCEALQTSVTMLTLRACVKDSFHSMMFTLMRICHQLQTAINTACHCKTLMPQMPRMLA